MTLVFNNNEYALERFSYTILKDKSSTQEKRINCILEKNTNIESLIDKLENEFDGNVVINTSTDQYIFDGYEFESLDVNGESDTAFIAVNFSK